MPSNGGVIKSKINHKGEYQWKNKTKSTSKDKLRNKWKN